jgi:hypothetical protein
MYKQNGGAFNFKSFARKAYNDATKQVKKDVKTASNFVNHQYKTKVKSDFIQARNEILDKAKDKANHAYNKTQDSAREAFGLTKNSNLSPTTDYYDDNDDNDYYDAHKKNVFFHMKILLVQVKVKNENQLKEI